MEKGKPLIFSGAIGKGHDQAARALKDELYQRGYEADIVNIFHTIHPFFFRSVLGSYISALTVTPKLWGKAYYFTQEYQFYKLFDHLGTLFQKHYLSLIEEHNCPFIVTTYYFATAFLAKLKEINKINIPVYNVITDLALHPIFIRENVDAIFTGAHNLEYYADLYNIPIEKFHHTGIPIRENEAIGQPKAKIREELDLAPDQKIILISGGGLGLTDYDKVVEVLAQFPERLQILCMTAHNERALKKLANVETHHNVKAFGFIDDFTKYLAASDAVISKGGSVTLSEALACEVPLIIYNPVPGHEEENAKFLIDQGAAIKAEMTESLPLLLERVLYEEKYYEVLKQNAQRLKRPDAAKDCVSIILSMQKEIDSPNDESPIL